jgi:hypothetical protein
MKPIKAKKQNWVKNTNIIKINPLAKASKAFVQKYKIVY